MQGLANFSAKGQIECIWVWRAEWCFDFLCWVTAYHKCISLKQHIFIVSLSFSWPGPEHGLVGSSAEGLIRLQSSEWLGSFLSGSSTWKRSTLQVHMVFGRVKFLVAVGLRLSAPKIPTVPDMWPLLWAIHTIVCCFFKASKSLSPSLSILFSQSFTQSNITCHLGLIM